MLTPGRVAERKNYHGNVMHLARAPPGKHPDQEHEAEECKAHEQVVSVFRDKAIEKLRHTCQV